MDERSTSPAAAIGCLSQIGLVALIGVGTMMVLGLTILFPPWAKVQCQRQELLYFSQRVKVYERSFVGFDFIFSDPKWRRTGPAAVSSGQLFNSTEYDIFWPVLVGEWIVVIVIAGTLFVAESRRLRSDVVPRS